MKQTITESMFHDAFRNYNHLDNFSYEARSALFKYLTDQGDRYGEEQELDVIKLCREYSEYDDALDWVVDNFFDRVGTDDDALEYLRDNTTVIEFNGGIIVKNF